MRTAAEPGAAPQPVPLPGTRRGDLALAGLAGLVAAQELVTWALVTPPGYADLLPAPVATVVGGVLVVALAVAVFFRRYRPRRAYVALAVLAAVQLAVVGGYASLLWPLLAFCVARAPQRGAIGALGWVATPFLLSSALAVVLRAAVGGAPGDGLALVLGGSITPVPLLVIATVVGRWSRAAALRAERERAETDRLRRAAALDVERARIAEELGGGVVAGLRALVARVETLDRAGAEEPELRAVRDRARSVLATMRRVLGVLRAPVGDRPAGPPGPVAPRAHGRPRGALPDRAGWAALLVFALPALVLGLLVLRVPDVPTDQPAVDAFLAMLRLPAGASLATAVVALQLAVVAWWRTAPVPALLIAGACSYAAGGLESTNLFADSAWALLVWGAATRAPVAVSATAVLVSSVVVAVGGVVNGVWARLGYPAPTVVLSFLAVVPLWVAGVAARSHRRATEVRRRALAEAGDRDAVARERLRVARDVHDVVAHHVSAVAVQAGAARMATDPGERARSLAHVHDSAARIARALPDLATLLPAPDAAALSRDAVDALVQPSRAAGLPVDVEVLGEPAATSGEAELFAGRILTEALTNTVRHAGATPTRVRVEHGADAVVVEVADDGPVAGHRTDGTGSGLGLIGMRERAALVGGDLRVGPGGRGWTVQVTLPRSPLVREDDPSRPGISSSTPIPRVPPRP